MTIRLTLTDRVSGEIVTIETPRTGEHIKDGKRRFIPPSKDATDGIIEALKVRSKLGAKGGCLA